IPRVPLSFPTRRSSDLTTSTLSHEPPRRRISVRTRALLRRRTRNRVGKHYMCAAELGTGRTGRRGSPRRLVHDLPGEEPGEARRSEEHTSELQSRENLV